MKNSRDAAVDYLMDRINWEQARTIPYAERTFRLDRMRRLLQLLDDPQDTLKIVHIAGTKGKGSTATMLASIFQAAGLKTGAYTSPHLQRIEERFAVDGKPCSGETFAELIQQIRPAIETVDREMPGDGPTYFEVTTAIALLCFAWAKVDVAVLEVGLGGRLDSTNVCRAEVSVITSISFDHTPQLGSTLTAIATEKAGIIKPGIPVISGVLATEAQAVIQQTCREHGSTLLELGSDFHVTGVKHAGTNAAANGCGTNFFDYHDAEHDYTEIRLAMLGAHQAYNAALAIATVHQLRRQGWAIDEQAIRQGLATAQCPARIELFLADEIFPDKPAIVIDAAHNGASVESLIDTIEHSIPASRRHLLFAASFEKDLPAMIGPLVRAFDRIVFTRYTINPRTVDPAELLRLAEEEREKSMPSLSSFSVEQARRLKEGIFEVEEDPTRAFERLCAEAGPDELVCVTGSFFIAAEIRQILVP